MEPTKTCTKCGETKPFTPEFFQPYPKMKSGFRNQCRACVNARRNERYQENRPQTRRERHEASPSPTKVCTKCGETKPRTAEFFHSDPLMIDEYRNECKACRLKYRLDWREANPERDRAAAKRHYERHPEQYRAWGRAYLERNREYRNAKGREYSKKYPADYYRAKHLRRRNREIAAGGGCTEADIERLHSEQGGRCFYCGEEYGDTYEVDHFIPVIAGGSGGPDNLVIACRFCNRSKGGRLPWEFLPERFAPPELCDSGNLRCDAFPEWPGIPWTIQEGDFDHTQPYPDGQEFDQEFPDDHGIQYEAWEDD